MKRFPIALAMIAGLAMVVPCFGQTRSEKLPADGKLPPGYKYRISSEGDEMIYTGTGVSKPAAPALASIDTPVAASSPVVAPWDVESRLAKIEADHAKMMARLDSIDSKLAQCPCIAQVTPTNTGGVDPVGDVVQHADGSYWIRSCGPNGCREYPYRSVNSYGVASAPMFFSAGGNCANGQCGPNVGIFGEPAMMYMGGGCASGNCGGMSSGPMMSGGGGCASGNCGGSSGGRGRRGRR